MITIEISAIEEFKSLLKKYGFIQTKLNNQLEKYRYKAVVYLDGKTVNITRYTPKFGNFIDEKNYTYKELEKYLKENHLEA